MSGGIEWAYEQMEAEAAYGKHVASGKFSKQYLESDIVRELNKEEIELLVTRLVIHYLGGWPKFFNSKFSSLGEVFSSLPKKAQKDFISRRALQVGLEVGPKAKMDKLRKRLEDMLQEIHPRSEE